MGDRQRFLGFCRAVWKARRGARALPWIAAVVTCGIAAAVQPASALDFTCIEASKYKYVLKLFGDDPRELSTYFNMAAQYQPPADACRAGLVTGKVERDDIDKALQFIQANRGWLAAFYLASPGGSVKGGVRVALAARMFWLKTIVVPDKDFRYLPDFAPPPTDPGAPGWSAFFAATDGVRTESVAYPKCTSACTYLLAAGIDRSGLAFVHRPDTSKDTSLDSATKRLERVESVMLALYRHMDAGPLEEAARSTANHARTPKTIPRFPRFVEDSLLKKCKSDVAQLDDVRKLLGWALAQDKDLPGGLVDASPLQASLERVAARSQATEQCVAGFQERERLGKYNGLCAKGCSVVETIKSQIDQQLSELTKG